MKQSLDRVFDIIELLADRNTALAVTDFAQELGMPASGAHRILALMHARAQLRVDPMAGHQAVPHLTAAGLSAVAAPVRVTTGSAPRAVAAVSIAGPTLRMPQDRLPELGKQMMAAAKELAGVWELLGTPASRLPRQGYQPGLAASTNWASSTSDSCHPR